ncbi:MAG: FliM/FliN family flagellar motor switch protein [Myxococcales bacterium]
MIVRRFELVSLDHLPANAGASSAEVSAMRLAALNQIAELRTSPFGKGVVTCTDVAAPAEPDQGDVVWALSRGGDASLGYLILEGMTALRIVAATLGVPASPAQRPLGTAERGIVTAAIATAFRSVRADLTVHLGHQPWAGRGRTRLFITANFQGLREHIRLDVFPHWWPPSDHRAWLSRATAVGLEFPFVLELARTTVTAADWSQARPGDALLFDGEAAATATGERPGQLTCGAFACPVMIAQDSKTASKTARMIAEFQPNRSPRSHHRLAEPKVGEPMSMPNESPDAALTMLASAPIEVVAELGRLLLRADEVTELRPGSVLHLGPLRPNSVALRVGDRTWAEGELVDVDGQLGVRLTSLTAPLPLNREIHPADADTLR